MIASALYQLPTSIIHFPTSPADQTAMEGLAKLGLATPASQGHADGWLISPAGWRIAMGYWGHDAEETP